MLAAYAPDEALDYVSLEGYVSANVLIEVLRRAGPQLGTEWLVEALENKRNNDLGLGTPIKLRPDPAPGPTQSVGHPARRQRALPSYRAVGGA